jgi:hypothetical protein
VSDARSYVDAWLLREPGMELARVFCPAAQRESFDLWGALLHQLDEAAFELRDATVARTKLAWWAEELAAMAAGTSRHPLARALSALPSVRSVPASDWRALVNAAMLAEAGEQAPADVEALLAQGAPHARATERIEAMIFGNDGAALSVGVLPGPVGSAPGEAVAVHHLLRRLEHSLGRDAARFPWPMNLRARHQAAPEAFAGIAGSPQAKAALADLAGDLGRRAAGLRGGTLFRRCQSALDARHLRQLAGGGAKRVRANGVATLWALWRAARRGH